MKADARSRRIAANTVRLVLAFVLGWSLMTAENAGAAPTFKLKPPREYFSDAKTLALVVAASTGDVARARQLVAEGANPNDEGPKDDPSNRIRLLHYAVAADDAVAVRTLIGVGADPELNAEGFGPALLFAVVLDKSEMLSLLIELRPISSLARETLRDLVFRSVALPRPRALEVLLNKGVPVDLNDDAGYTPLMRAIDAQDYELAQWLVSKGASVHAQAKSGMTPAYSVQYDLQRFNPDSTTYAKVLRLQQSMQARGAVFPAPSPKEVRDRRGRS